MLTCVRDGRTLFKNLDLSLEPGAMLQVQGANGAGKTSLLRILCGLAEPREGTVRWAGTDIRRCRADYYRDLLYIGHSPGIKLELSALENLRFSRSLGGHSHQNTALEDALDQIGLYGYEDVPVRSLSAGQRRRVALARLWFSKARLWVLDEPFTAIDREGINHLEHRLTEHVARDGMIILTSHQALQLEQVPLRHLTLDY